jgi:Zn-dependent peptidase ImmA (M78 family)
MSRPFISQLESRSIGPDDLVRNGFASQRAADLFAGEDPTVNELRSIAKTFKIPLRALFSARTAGSSVEFKLRENFKKTHVMDGEIFDWISRAETLSLLLPENSEKRYSFEIDFKDKNYGLAEELAEIFRLEILKIAHTGPLIDLERMVRACTNVRSLIIDQPHLEGSVVAHHDHFFIFLSTRPDPRMRFTFAHELCHYLCDVGSSGDSAWFDEDVLDPVGSDRRDEVFANAFASALLLPASGVGDAMRTIRDMHRIMDDRISDLEILLLARFYGVSFQVAARRLEDLKILPEGGGQSLYQEINKKYKSPERLAEKLGLPKRALYDWHAVNRYTLLEARPALELGAVSIGRLSETVNVPIAEALQVISA